MARKAYVIDGKAIKHWLVDNDMTRSQLAEEAGISGSTLRHAIDDGRNCGIDVLLNLSRAMDARPWDLVREAEPIGGGAR